MSLPRELHLWLQGLDLPLPIKQPRRDFSNGYLIAQLLHRYRPDAIDLHHYRTGSSLDHRLSNWAVLERAMVKLGLSVPRAQIDALLHAQPNAHTVLLSSLYAQLTGKAVRTFVPPPPSSAAPTFLAATASTAVKARMGSADVLGGLGEALDDAGRARAVERTLTELSEERREERKKRSTALRQHMAQQRMVYAAITAPDSAANPPSSLTCTLKTVTVRQSATPAMPLTSVLASATRPSPPRSSASALNAVVVNAPVYEYRQSGPPFQEFIAGLSALSDAAVSAIVDAVAVDALDTLTANAVASPRDFYCSLTLLFPLLQRPPLPSAAFQSAVSLLAMWGERLRAKDPSLAPTLAVDYLLPKLLPLVATQPQKLHAVMPLLYAFHGEAGADRAALMASLTALVAPTTSLLLTVSALLQADVNDATVEAALPYVSAHLASADPVIRALALSLLAPIAGEADAGRVWREWWPAIDGITAESHPSSWCEQAEAVHVTCCLLASEHAAVDRDAALGLLGRLLRPTTSFPLVAAALPHLARVLGVLPPLRPLFFALLEREGVRPYALAGLMPAAVGEEDVRLLGLMAVNLRAVWVPGVMVQVVLDTARSARMACPLPPLYVEVLACAVSDASSPAFAEAFAALVPAVLPLMLPSLGAQSRLVLGTLGLVLSSPVTRGYGLAVMRPTPATGLLVALGAQAVEDVVEWMWAWLDDEDEEAEEGNDAIREAMRRLVNAWQDRLTAEQSAAADLPALLRRLEQGRGSVKQRQRREEEEKESGVEAL